MPTSTLDELEHLPMEDAAVVAVRGDLEPAARTELRSLLCLLGHVHGAVAVGVAEAPLGHSAGPEVFEEVHDRLSGVRARLTPRAPSPRLRSQLERTGLDAKPSTVSAGWSGIGG